MPKREQGSYTACFPAELFCSVLAKFTSTFGCRANHKIAMRYVHSYTSNTAEHISTIMARYSAPPPNAQRASATPRQAPALDPASQIIMSHAQFLLAQTKQNVQHLAATNTLDPLVCRQLQAILESARIQPPPAPPAPAPTTVAKKDAKKELKGKNKWAHDVISETSLLPTLVDTALSAAAGPLISSGQREAIVELVSMSQKKIAETITDPERQAAAQAWTRRSTETAQQNLRTGFQNTGKNWSKWSQRLDEEAGIRRNDRKEKKALEEELLREREQFVGHSGGGDVVRRGAMDSTLAVEANNPASASVACFPSDQFADEAHEGSTSNAGAVTTTFSPWPGLILTMSTVATSVSVDSTVMADQGTDHRSLPPPPPSAQPELPPKPSIHSQVQPPPARKTTNNSSFFSPMSSSHPIPSAVESSVTAPPVTDDMQAVPPPTYSPAPSVHSHSSHHPYAQPPSHAHPPPPGHASAHHSYGTPPPPVHHHHHHDHGVPAALRPANPYT